MTNIKNMHAMLDIEALGQNPGSVILSIGGVKFNPYSFQEPKDSFYMKPSPDEQETYGRESDYDTIRWWINQRKEVQHEVFSYDKKNSFSHTMTELFHWFNDVEIVWAHNYAYDLTLLYDAFSDLDMAIPWEHNKKRDSKTLFSIIKENSKSYVLQESEHNAYYDAYYQAKNVQIAFDILGLHKE